ncbi:tautomerase family protein [Defluviimonas sp. SAOS-178_SWC]|uniref:tautomerase family protein n=1 Tax=Defluviimonas sp. SAOS-178_SWC TaxID=3121287 RepID=UPI003221C9C0
MPYVSIRLAGPGPNDEQCEVLIEGVTDLIATTLNKPREMVMVVIDDIAPTHYGVGGQSVRRMRQRSSS